MLAQLYLEKECNDSHGRASTNDLHIELLVRFCSPASLAYLSKEMKTKKSLEMISTQEKSGQQHREQGTRDALYILGLQTHHKTSPTTHENF